MKSVLRDHTGLQKLVKEAIDITPELALPDEMALFDSPDGLGLESIPASVLADTFESDMFDKTAEHTRNLIPVLQDFGSSLKHHHRRHHLNENEEYEDFDFDSGEPNHFGDNDFTSGRRDSSSFGDPFTNNFGSSKFTSHGPMTRKIMRDMHNRFQLPQHLKQHSNEARRKHRRRLQQDNSSCQVCELSNTTCSCNRLKKCVSLLFLY